MGRVNSARFLMFIILLKLLKYGSSFCGSLTGLKDGLKELGQGFNNILL